MAVLPLLGWSKELIERRLAFLVAASRFVPPTGEEGARLEPGSAAVTDVRALLAAADLAFATDRTNEGLRLLDDAVDAMVERGNLLAAVLPGSILLRMITELKSDSVSIVDNKSGRRASSPLPPPSPAALEALTDLILASRIRGAFPGDDDRQFFSRWPEPLIGSGEPLLQAVAAFVSDDYWDGAQTGLIANTAFWMERLGRCRMDEYHWNRGQVRSPLVDLRRVAFELALIVRPGGANFREWLAPRRRSGLAGAVDAFAAQLASEIAAGEQRFAR